MPERVVVVTGSSGGIGSAIVDRFTAAGDIVVGLDLLDGVDVSQPDDCAAAAARIIAEHGRIDVLCNNAGIGATGDVVASSPEDWQRVFAVNVFGVANMSRAVLPAMRAAGRGAVVNTCSVVASVGLVDRAVYSASKGAVLALTRAMAADEIRLRHTRQLRLAGHGREPVGRANGRRPPRSRGRLRGAPPAATARPHGHLRGGRGRGRVSRRRHDVHDRRRLPARRRHHRRAPRRLMLQAGRDAARRPRRRPDVRPAVRHVHTGRGRGRRARRSPDAQPAGGRHARGRRAHRRARDPFQVRAVAVAVVASRSTTSSTTRPSHRSRRVRSSCVASTTRSCACRG